MTLSNSVVSDSPKDVPEVSDSCLSVVYNVFIIVAISGFILLIMVSIWKLVVSKIGDKSKLFNTGFNSSPVTSFSPIGEKSTGFITSSDLATKENTDPNIPLGQSVFKDAAAMINKEISDNNVTNVSTNGFMLGGSISDGDMIF